MPEQPAADRQAWTRQGRTSSKSSTWQPPMTPLRGAPGACTPSAAKTNVQNRRFCDFPVTCDRGVVAARGPSQRPRRPNPAALLRGRAKPVSLGWAMLSQNSPAALTHDRPLGSDVNTVHVPVGETRSSTMAPSDARPRPAGTSPNCCLSSCRTMPRGAQIGICADAPVETPISAPRDTTNNVVLKAVHIN